MQVLKVGTVAASAQSAGLVKIGRLDLDHIRAPVGELAHTGRPGSRPGQIEDPETAESVAGRHKRHFLVLPSGRFGIGAAGVYRRLLTRPGSGRVRLPEGFEHEHVGRKGQLRQTVQGTEPGINSIVAGPKVAADPPAVEPDADGLALRPPEVAVGGADLPDVHHQAGFLQHLSRRGRPDRFVPSHVPTGNAPEAGFEPIAALHQEDVVPLDDDHGDADRGSPEHPVAARLARPRPLAVDDDRLDGSAARHTEARFEIVAHRVRARDVTGTT
jgi:hypothetical protein